MEWVVQGTVVRVIDGDTIVVDLDLGWHITYHNVSVRVAGINSPELNTQAGKEARDHANARLPVGTVITVVSHTLDKYGRVLGTMLLSDGSSFGKHMLDDGFAEVYG